MAQLPNTKNRTREVRAEMIVLKVEYLKTFSHE
jgi:hypothetical protein